MRGKLAVRFEDNALVEAGIAGRETRWIFCVHKDGKPVRGH